jgi:hypothetical protein
MQADGQRGRRRFSGLRRHRSRADEIWAVASCSIDQGRITVMPSSAAMVADSSKGDENDDRWKPEGKRH